MKKGIIIILAFFAFLYFFVWKKEQFALDDLADLETNDQNGNKIVWNIQNIDGKELISSAFTPVECNNQIISQNSSLIPPSMKGWTLKMISKGIYIFEKPNQDQCLYTFSGLQNSDSLRSYTSSSCNHRSLCGLDTLDFNGSIDENSLRTYFRVVNAEEGKYNIISVKTNKYICLNDNGVYLSTTPNDKCLFNFTKL